MYLCPGQQCQHKPVVSEEEVRCQQAAGIWILVLLEKYIFCPKRNNCLLGHKLKLTLGIMCETGSGVKLTRNYEHFPVLPLE